MARLLARYDDESGLERGIQAAAATAGIAAEEVFGPVPVELPGAATSGVRRWVLGGGFAGAVAGIVLTVGTALDLPLVVGGKPIVSGPPFLVVVFELGILLAALGGVAGFLVSAGLPRRQGPPEGYEPELSVDGFGLLVRCQDAGEATRALEESGARRVRRLQGDGHGRADEAAGGRGSR